MAFSSNSFTQFLRESALFSALPDEDLPAIADGLVEVELPAGEILFEEGEEVDGVFLVETGKLVGFDQEQHFNHSYQRGDVLGLATRNLANQRQETIQAQTNSRVWFFSGANLQHLCEDRPAFAETLTVLANSQIMLRRVHMPWLEADERVSLIARKHPVFLLFALIPPLLTFAASLLALNFVQAENAMAALVGMVIAFLICATWLLWNINNWANDYYLVTSKRMVWVEKVSGFYESRQEAPLATLISVGVKTTQLGALLGYSDVIVRTFIGDIRFERVAHAKTIGKLIESYWSKSKHVDLELDAREIRKALREKFGKSPEEVTSKELEEEYGIDSEMPYAEIGFFEWLFSDFLKVRYEAGGSITYRKHWIILLRKLLLAFTGLLLTLAFIIAMLTRNITGLDYSMALPLGLFLLLVFGAVMIYQYVDWRNDVFQLTPNQVIDLDRKPFGRESRRAAPLENILSIEYERRGIIPMLFNYGTVYISVGNTQLTFNNVHQPSKVQQDIFSRIGTHTQEKEDRQTAQERDRIAQWFKVFQEESRDLLASQDVTSPLNPPPG
ncbi:MAG: cyclic nucleotide-binding domain-containing protein [Anaerolineaceae bacterium]|nr:cyclic nucleotide-binding domain-containing protein [Anaerolineaceae bacterium]MDD4042389.1 cyclic nucleotide-binding domain-containing protein [Anaerolineaceae bacterium]MDD4578002.1 cyclic nucleotide-binding domain-containing protein [Anaerolineaceae bacterium]